MKKIVEVEKGHEEDSGRREEDMKKTVAGKKRALRKQCRERRENEEYSGRREENMKNTVAGEKRS